MHPIHIGVGGWEFDPWDDSFYPSDLKKKDRLRHMASQLSAVEVNGTFYRTQKPETFAKWAAEAPDGFVFALKAVRYAVNRRVLAEAGDSIERFIGSGITELGPKLGPILWQFAPTKKFDAGDMAAFLDLLPDARDGHRLLHAVEPRHDSFHDPAFADLCRDRGIAIVRAADSDYPEIDAATADFAYLRIMGTTEGEDAGYSEQALDRWAATVRDIARDREVFLFVISGHKALNPLAARALIDRVS